MPCFHMYSTFECHFKPNHKKQSDMVDPVGGARMCRHSRYFLVLTIIRHPTIGLNFSAQLDNS